MDPLVLLIDEPLSALDAQTRETLKSEVENIWAKDKKTVVLITNDVDEGILLADRIIPLTAGPGATLGPSIEVDIRRPRDRKSINHDPRFKRIRKSVIDYLLAEGAKKHATVSRKLVLPEIEPEDLSVPRPFLRRGPVRRREVKRVEVEA